MKHLSKEEDKFLIIFFWREVKKKNNKIKKKNLKVPMPRMKIKIFKNKFAKFLFPPKTIETSGKS